MSLIQLQTARGAWLRFDASAPMTGGMKDAYFTPERDAVIAFFRQQATDEAAERLDQITGEYRQSIMDQPGGDYWAKIFCWPSDLALWEGRLGVLTPTYPQQFFFEHGSYQGDRLGLRGKEKQGKWFASAHLRQTFLDPREHGDWRGTLRACLQLAQGVRRLHAAGLAHGDLSYKNALMDPISGTAALIDLDGLVVPGKFPPEVLGTPEFIAPEILKGAELPLEQRPLPGRAADLHALAVLIYGRLLLRHPLRGRLCHDEDPERNENLLMGTHALWIEDPNDPSNRPDLMDLRPADMLWADVRRLPYTCCGAPLAELFATAFGSGLHNPATRPGADAWEYALARVLDLLLPCHNPNCQAKWFPLPDDGQHHCPFCGSQHTEPVWIAQSYSAHEPGAFRSDQRPITLHAGRTLHTWHAWAHHDAPEKLSEAQHTPVGTIQDSDQGPRWFNHSLSELTVKTQGQAQTIAPGESFLLVDGQQVLCSRQAHGRLFLIQKASPHA